ncbi:hypothetical protein ACHAP8_005715 [Fusarium lateritium]
MENPRDTQTSKVIAIASDGDLILIVGPEETKLRVRSMFLMTVSKPFAVMLGPNWKEGQDMRDPDGPFHLSLPEDNAIALKIICSVVHYQNKEVPRTLPAGDVLAVAVVADKYDCVNALEFASDTWLRPPGDDPDNLMLLTAAAYLFRNAQAFKEITRALVLGHDGAYHTLSSDEVESAMPWKVFSLLEEQRGFANDHPVSLLERPGRDRGHDRAMAAGAAGRIEQYRRRKWGDGDQGAFESLAAVYDLGKRRRYQSIWTSLVGFIAHSHSEGTLEEMGMRLTESQIDDILDVEQEVWQVDLKAIARNREKGGFEYIWVPIRQLLMKTLRKAQSTPRNNPHVWWIAVLARSAVSSDSDIDFISRGRFHRNPMPMDVDLRERLEAIVYYSKVLVLDSAFSTWSERSERSEWVIEVQSRLNIVSIE